MLVAGHLLDTQTDVPPRGWIRVDGDRIDEVGYGDPPRTPDVGGPGCFISPGFVDAHLHLPQWDLRGYDGLDLLGWLDQVIYPGEARWADLDVARTIATRALRDLLRAGTMVAAPFLTSHVHAAAALAEAQAAWPLRLLAGIVLMDRHAPDALLTGREPLDAMPPRTGSERLSFSVNPRFAVSCTAELLARAARATDRRVHTHLAEQRAECARVRELYPDCPNYAGVYDRAGLLRPGTLLAHAIHLDEDEWTLLAQRGCAVVHCPTANAFLGSGMFSIGTARRHGVPVALGSDIAAGPDVAMPRVARAMIDVARLRHERGDPDAAWVPTPRDAWRLITRDGADVLGMEQSGRLEPGADADLLVLEPAMDADAFTYGRLIHTWDERHIRARLLAGSMIDRAC